MKNYIFILLIIAGTGFSFSQNQASDFTGTKSDQARNPRNDLMNFVPNEVLVKFKDAVPVAAGARMKAAGVSSVDKVLQAYGVTSLEKLFPTAQKPQKSRMMKSPQGKDMTIPSLDKIYRVSVPEASTNAIAHTNIFQLIEELKALPEVEYAEPNYIYSIDNMQPVGPILTAEDVAMLRTNKQRIVNDLVIPNDPLYGQQWYIPAVKADSVWQQTTGDTTQVIAILDTGVDWNHPDLKNKIWTNPNPNTYPDANGVINDIRGWDYINNDNNPMDDNSHGTHVAGIAAAETNNGIGIAGVCPKAKIMPIKVFQSSGRGDAATITKGIIYASTHGASVINMSFGSYAHSLAMEDALANAYATSMLVAAAGNDGIMIGPCNTCAPLFPSALSFVLGVQASDGGFSNIDQDGPVFSDYPELWNYEMKAPGANILSTIPNGNYRIYQGTSMATPIVSGAVCLYKNRKPDDSQELMWGNLINTIGSYININSAVNIVPTPKLMFVNKTLVDTLAGDNKNGLVNAGETIQLWFNVRNTWGQCDSVKVGLKFGEFEDTSKAQIITSTALIGSVSPYANRNNEQNPLKIHINSDVANDRDITFVASLYYPNSQDTIKQNIVLNINNGVELSGVMDSTLILTSDKLWLVNGSFRVASKGVLLLKPGTRLILNQNIVNHGKIVGVGKPDSLIYISGPGTIYELMNYGSYLGSINLNYANLYGINSMICGDSITIRNSILDEIKLEGFGEFLLNSSRYIFAEDNLIINSTFSKLFSFLSSTKPVHFKRNNIYNCFLTDYKVSSNKDCVPLSFNNFVKIKDYKYVNFGIKSNAPLFLITGSMPFYNNFISFGEGTLVNYAYSGEVINLPNQYWGTTKIEKIKKMNWDFWNDPNLPMVNYLPIMTQPSDSAHAIVWKVLINGKDAQDEVIEPVGVGKQRFDVYFNREMNKTVIPQVSFGVRYPYSQQAVNEDGSWSEDGKIYTAYKTIKLTTGDGINRIRVAGVKETNGWEHEIPVEDQRFNLLISATSSSSLDFMATPGLGKVQLEWNNNDLEDGLGYNMYRMEHINDSTLTTPVLINSNLITDTLYTDFAVTPNKKYYYYYKILRTNMVETDSSKVASAIPFTAAKGDANGDLTVNVLDITSIVAYLLNNNPQPFIIEAADLNSDGSINVLDIVGVVNKILNIPQGAPGIAMIKRVDLFLENDTLFANSNTDIGGIQLDIKGVNSIEDIQILSALSSFESGNSIISDSLRLIFYSMSGKNIPAGQRIPLLKMKTGSSILDAIFGETNGSPIKVNYILTRIGDIQNNMNQTAAELGQNFPNPVNGRTVIPVRIYEPVEEAVLRVINMIGQQVEVIRLLNPYIGEHLLSWNSGANKGLFVYTLEVKKANQRSVCPNKKMIVQ